MKYIGSALLLTLLFCAGMGLTRAQRRSAVPRQPIIDMHVHAHTADRFGKASLPNPVTGKPSAAVTDDDILKMTLAEMRRYNITKAVAGSFMESAERWRAAAADLFIKGAQIDVGIPMPDIDQLRAEYRAGRLGAIGEVGGQYLGMSPGDPALEPYFALAEELDIPVGVHMGVGPPNATYECCPKFRMSLGNPLLLEEVLVRHPKLRLYIMHAGYPFLRETIAVMHLYPQVYADIAVINWVIPREEFHDYLRGLMRAGMGRRIMFGSDQMIWPEAIGMAVEGTESAPFLTAEQKRDIFYHNAARFLRLDKTGNVPRAAR
ncbi:MAG TPA: amidohydrolase family protein [Abditibacteriaceae bacterium]|nr:amidohydrolase family protein [Abditibacteriaceae bacterium]